LTSALDGGEWSVSHPGRLTPKERTPGTHWLGGWVGPRTGIHAVVRRKFPAPIGIQIPDHPARSPVLQH